MENLMQALGMSPGILIEVCGEQVFAWPVAESVAERITSEAVIPDEPSHGAPEWTASSAEEIDAFCEGLRKLLRARREYLKILGKLDREAGLS